MPRLGWSSYSGAAARNLNKASPAVFPFSSNMVEGPGCKLNGEKISSRIAPGQIVRCVRVPSASQDGALKRRAADGAADRVSRARSSTTEGRARISYSSPRAVGLQLGPSWMGQFSFLRSSLRQGQQTTLRNLSKHVFFCEEF